MTRKISVAALSLSVLCVGLLGTGCKVLKMAAKTQKHAAIAYDEKTGGWGYSYDQLTEDLAKSAATSKCGTCTVRLSWNQGCGALAQSETKRDIMTTATGATRLAAEGAARAACVGAGGGNCKILVFSCNSTK
ncbi:MAG: DUF4189 domain-containing protein [Polyangiaceae bacterium]|nr:DUF4189 domain-containing protein [Polyangiaceae bacterium]